MKAIEAQLTTIIKVFLASVISLAAKFPKKGNGLKDAATIRAIDTGLCKKNKPSSNDWPPKPDGNGHECLSKMDGGAELAIKC